MIFVPLIRKIDIVLPEPWELEEDPPEHDSDADYANEDSVLEEYWYEEQ